MKGHKQDSGDYIVLELILFSDIFADNKTLGTYIMHYLPEDLYSEVFKVLPRDEYRSFSSASKDMSRIERKNRKMITLHQDTKTAFYEGYHMTEYQTLMLRHLIRNGVNSKYLAIPDFYNLSIIGFLYAIELSKFMKVSLYVRTDTYAQFMDNIKGISSLEKLVHNVNIITDLTNYNKDYFVIELTLECSQRPSSLLQLSVSGNAIHPSYETVYRNKVWVSNNEKISNDKVAIITRKRKLSQNNYSTYSYPISSKIVSEYETFFVVDEDINHILMVNDIFSTLSQLSKGPKKLITLNYLPLPYKFILDTPKEIYINNYNVLNRISGLTYAELVILTRLDLPDIDDESIEKVQSWLKKTSRRNVLKIKEEEIYIDESKVKEALPWILINPNQNINDTPLASIEPIEDEKYSIIRSNVKYIMDNPTIRSGTYTILELKEIAKDLAISISSKDTKLIMAKKIYESISS